MSYTKSQVSNFLNDKVLFRFSISNDFIIEFDDYKEFFTFEELERIIKVTMIIGIQFMKVLQLILSLLGKA